MFTGIIQAVGRIARLEPRGGDVRLVVDTAALPEVVVLPGGTPVRVRVASVSTPAPAGAYLALTTERLT